jgi:hypothetical protein
MLSLRPVQAMILTVLTVLLICTDAKKLGGEWDFCFVE